MGRSLAFDSASSSFGSVPATMQHPAKALSRFPSNDDRLVVFAKQVFLNVKAKFRRPLIRIRPVTRVTGVRQDRTDIPIEVHHFRRLSPHRRCRSSQANRH